jgi:hypothetical protein
VTNSAASVCLIFDDPGLLENLETIPLDRIDEIGFGLIVMNRSGEVTGYNASESKRSGLAVERSWAGTSSWTSVHARITTWSRSVSWTATSWTSSSTTCLPSGWPRPRCGCGCWP